MLEDKKLNILRTVIQFLQHHFLNTNLDWLIVYLERTHQLIVR